MTKLEADLLRNIAENYFAKANGGIPDSLEDVGRSWSDQLSDGGPIEIKSKSIPGLVTSLIKKGLVESDRECVWLTQAGFDAYQTL